jgi:hypothetical protein
MPDRIRIAARDAFDVAIIAAYLQDARVPVREMAYLTEERRFCLAFTRYRRELLDDPTSCAGLTERSSALTVNEVENVRVRGLDALDQTTELSLLTITVGRAPGGLNRIELVFAGAAGIQIDCRAIDCRLEDFGEPVVSRVTPCDHSAEPATEGAGGGHGG